LEIGIRVLFEISVFRRTVSEAFVCLGCFAA